MCKQPAMRAPFKGFEGPCFCRRDIRPGISFSAKVIALRPHSANLMSAEKQMHLHYPQLFLASHVFERFRLFLIILITDNFQPCLF